MRRSPQLDADGHSTKEMGTVGYVDVAQKLDHGTSLAAHASPFAPHSQTGTPAWTLFTWKWR